MSAMHTSSHSPRNGVHIDSGRRLKRPGPGRRNSGPVAVTLLELAPMQVVEGRVVPGGMVAPDVLPAGTCREMCPHCHTAPLVLVLRSNHVVRTHLFCEQCTRCFDAVGPDGASVLDPVAVPIY